MEPGEPPTIALDTADLARLVRELAGDAHSDIGGPVDTGGARRVLGIGVDVCSIERMRTALARTPRFSTRLFTEAERTYAEGFADPAGVYAARFAAKEAAMKAMGVGIEDVPFIAIELVRAASGAPSLVLHGRAAVLADERGIATIHVSVSHDAGVAVAFAVAVG